MTSYDLLDQVEEEGLHKTRLLTVEERPFKRITKRLLDPEKSLISKKPSLLPTPPPDADGTEDATADEEQRKDLEGRRLWREDAILDFAAFESSIVRTQFLFTSNEEERGGYARKKLKIEETAQAVRDNTASLRIQLAEAQQTLSTRKEYDQLAEKITSNRLLRPRDEQHSNLQKLHAEIAELERESREYAELWNRRREQFDKIIQQTTEMQRQIKDEKEEVERREGMEEREEAEDEQGEGVSGAATPLHGGEKEASTDAVGLLLVQKSQQARAKTPLQESQAPTEFQGHESSSQDKTDGEAAEDGEVPNDTESVQQETSEGLVEEEDATDDRPASRERMDVT